jgi:signal transduction histidine kinase
MLTEQLMWPMGDYGVSVVAAAALVLLEALGVFWLTEFAVRLKTGQWWKRTLIYVVLRAVGRALRYGGRLLWKGILGIPTIPATMIVFFGICIVELAGILTWCQAEFFVLWLLVKLIEIPAVVYLALVCKKLLAASEAMANGEEGYVVDTAHMIGQLREHGENLNRLSQGISKAVAARMRSERLKTELITNVSHDIKTPLTSIINYADLISAEETDNPRITEYSQVLLRQSERLKKLLEDLLEASKATTGNLEVDLKPCEVGVLLTQAVGEYQKRMEERHLELRTSQPEEPVRVMADGRHLWRVFDNLLNNICKYAQENSRVYVSVEMREKKVHIIFRNMSKYALDITGEELEERFVRGDRSRHMEGNGLGLSIAKSLTELLNGSMTIVTDGDLFKVMLEFSGVD